MVANLDYRWEELDETKSEELRRSEFLIAIEDT